MASAANLIFLTVLAVLPLLGLGNVCLQPEVTSDVYTTTEATVSAETVVIIQFSLKCKGRDPKDLKDLNLYAQFKGGTFPASRVEGLDGVYQVSWSDEHKNIPAGVYDIQFFDEEGHSDFKKAQRSGEDTSNIKSLFTVTVDHPGATRGLGIPTELLATLLAGGVWYMAYAAKNRLS